MTAAKKVPQDHKKKDEKFSFVHDGKTYTFEKDFSELRTLGAMRRLTRMSEAEAVIYMFEGFAGDEALEVLDKLELDSPEFEAIMNAMNESISGGGINQGN